MTELSKLFESYYQEQSETAHFDNANIKKTEKALFSFIDHTLSEDTQIILNRHIDRFAEQLEQHAFITGYTRAVKLILEVINPHI